MMKSPLVRSLALFTLLAVATPLCISQQESSPAPAPTPEAAKPAPPPPAASAYDGPGRSKSEHIAILYIKTLVNAQREYKKKRGEYAASLSALVNHGSFTKRMSRPDRGDYQVKFSSNGQNFWVVLNPKEFTPEKRSFFSDSSGNIRAQENEPANGDSPLL